MKCMVHTPCCLTCSNFNFAGCYGINDEDSDSGKSNDTDSPTELWFCDACKVGLQPVSLFQSVHLNMYICSFFMLSEIMC